MTLSSTITKTGELRYVRDEKSVCGQGCLNSKSSSSYSGTEEQASFLDYTQGIYLTLLALLQQSDNIQLSLNLKMYLIEKR